MQAPGLISVLKLLAKAISAWEKQISAQNAFLERIADAIAPVPMAPSEEPVLLHTDDEEEAHVEFKELLRKHGWNEETAREEWEQGPLIP